MKMICMDPKIRLKPIAAMPYMLPKRMPLIRICKKTLKEEKLVTILSDSS
jgi:hypothetical protein